MDESGWRKRQSWRPVGQSPRTEWRVTEEWEAERKHEPEIATEKDDGGDERNRRRRERSGRTEIKQTSQFKRKECTGNRKNGWKKGKTKSHRIGKKQKEDESIGRTSSRKESERLEKRIGKLGVSNALQKNYEEKKWRMQKCGETYRPLELKCWEDWEGGIKRQQRTKDLENEIFQCRPKQKRVNRDTVRINYYNYCYYYTFYEAPLLSNQAPAYWTD